MTYIVSGVGALNSTDSTQLYYYHQYVSIIIWKKTIRAPLCLTVMFYCYL